MGNEIDLKKAEKFYQLFKDTFLMELLDVDTSNSSGIRNDPDDNEQIEMLGEMSELEKRVYLLRNRFARLHKGVHIQLRYDDGIEGAEEEKLKRSCSVLSQYEEALTELMWALIRDRFSLQIPAGRGLGVRNKWKAVSIEDNGPKFPEGLKAIIGRIKL